MPENGFRSPMAFQINTFRQDSFLAFTHHPVCLRIPHDLKLMFSSPIYVSRASLIPYWQITETKFSNWDITQRHSRKQNPKKNWTFWILSHEMDPVKNKADNLFIDENIHIYAFPGNYKVFKLIHSVECTTIRPKSWNWSLWSHFRLALCH